MYLSIQTAFQANSNSLNAEMIRFYLRGRYIDQFMKDRSLARMKANNRLGGEFITEVSFVHTPEKMFGTTGWSWYTGLKSRWMFGAEFSKDAYQLGFYGNAPFAGSTLQIGKLKADYLAYQQISAGFIRTIQSNSNAHQIGFALSYVNGNSFFSTSTDRASLYTDSLGQNLKLDLNGQFVQNDPSKQRFAYPNGMGAGLDFFYNASFKNGKHSISVQATDIGFIRWSDFGTSNSLDTSIQFSGIQVPHVFNLNEQFFTGLSDSVRTIFDNTRSTGNRILMLPGTISVAYTWQAIPSKLFIMPNFQMKFFTGYAPRAGLNIIGYPYDKIMMCGKFTYGGFGGFNVGADLGFDLGKGWMFTAGTQTIDGFFFERVNSGLSGNVGLVKWFKPLKSKKGAGKSVAK